MNSQRYLCSELVALRNNSSETVVNLEEIWETGAVLESETPVENGARVEIRSGSVFFAGRVAKVREHEFGWRVEVEFSPLTPWSRERFEPQHFLDTSRLE